MDSHVTDDDEIDLFEVLSILLRRKKLIIGITAAAMIGSILFSVGSLVLPSQNSYLPNLYTPKANMLINDSSSSGGSVSSLLSSSGLGSLASLAGVNVSGGSTYSALAVYIAGSDPFLDAVVDKFDLVTRYKIKKFQKADSRMALAKKLSASFDKDSGVFTIQFTDYDPVFAKDVVNYCVEYMENRFNEIGLDKNKLQKVNLETNINNTYEQILSLESQSRKLERSASYGENAAGIPSIMTDTKRIALELKAQEEVYSQLKIQYELLKVTMASDTPVFQVLEYASVTDKKSEPSRGVLVIIVTASAFFCSIILVFILNAMRKVSNDPVAMAKLKGKTE